MIKTNLLKRALVVALVFSQFSYSQSTENLTKEKQPIKIGFKAGYSLGKLSNSSDNIYTQNYESTNGFDWGFTFEFPITTLFSFQTEINFTQRGGKRTGIQPITSDELSEQLNQFLPFVGLPLITNSNPLYATFDSESKLSYLEIPALAKFGWGDDFRFFSVVGPYVAILLNAEQKTSGSSQLFFDADGNAPVFVPNPGGQPDFITLPEQSLTANTDVSDDLKTVNFGGIIGVGASKKVGDKGEIFADARASYSFNSIQFNDELGKSHVGGIVFSLGYAYTL